MNMISNMNTREKREGGFTLLELLIVIAIIAILSVALVFVLNPAETLKKSRDAQRISDLKTLKTAIGLYLTSVSTPDLDAAVANVCLGSANTAAQISYSFETTDVSCAVNIAEGTDVATGSSFSATDMCRYVAANAFSVDGTGWVPVNLTSLTGGSPISALPADPVNTVAAPATPVSTDLVYRYACQNAGTTGKPSYVFEVDAQLESDAYTLTDDRRAKDGGDNPNYYEVGTSLKLIGAGATPTNF